MIAGQSDALHVLQLNAVCTVPTGHPSPLRVKQRIDEAAQDGLPEALTRALRPLSGRNDGTVWFIRKLDVELDVNAAWNRDRLARRWAIEVTRILAETLRDGSIDGVIRFDSWAAYLARFVRDLAAGEAWGKWYHEHARGLRHLPASAAIRTVLVEDGEAGREALGLLSDRDLRTVIQAIHSADARRVVDRFAAGGTNGTASASFDTLWTVMRETDHLPEMGEASGALYLYVKACRMAPGGPMLRDMSVGLVRLARYVTSQAAKGHAEALTPTDSPVLADLILRQVPIDRLRAAAQVLQARGPWTLADDHETTARRNRGGSLSGVGERRSTPFGGIFLLLPILDSLPFDGATEEWSDAAGTSAASLLRFLVLIKCTGPGRARRVAGDPLVRDVMRMAPGLTREQVVRWQRKLGSKHLGALTTGLAAWHRARGNADGEIVSLRTVALPGAPAAVLVDHRRGVWLHAQGYVERCSDPVGTRVREWLERANLKPRTVFADDVFFETLTAALPEADVRKATERLEIEASVVLAARLADDLRQLRLPDSSRPFDLAAGVAAQGVLRTFAARLPGFAASSLSYLFSNFLDVPADVEEQPDRRVVRIGRAPLQPVLDMTSMARAAYRVHWLDGKPFELFPE